MYHGNEEAEQTIKYDLAKMIRAGQLINCLKLCGAENFRIAAELSDILDSGKIEKAEDVEGVEENGI